jgi:DNA-binding MarR family transcriptional regulator
MSKIPNGQHAVNQGSPERGVAGGRSTAGEALSALVVRVFRLNGQLAAAGDALARPAGQTTARWQVLAAVEDEPMSVAQIARALGLARQSVQRVADALEVARLVAYRDNPNHRRARLVELTEAGRATLHAIQAEQAPWANALGDAIGERDLRRANELLDRVLQAMSARDR